MPTTRLEAFSDCVIAFAITLLVLEVRLPELGAQVSNAQMLRALLALLPEVVLYVSSFVLCTVWWISHHRLVHDLRAVDAGLLWINSLFLMLIAFLPFPTGLLGHHVGQPVATAFYGVCCAGIGGCFAGLRWYAALRPVLLHGAVPAARARRRARLSLLSPALYLAGALLSLAAAHAALVLYAAIPLYFAALNLRGTESGQPAPPLRQADAKVM